SLLATESFAGSACPARLDGVTPIGVRTTDEDCIPPRWRDRANNVVQSGFLTGLTAGFLEMRGGFTPVLPIRHPRPDESAGGVPIGTPPPQHGCAPNHTH